MSVDNTVNRCLYVQNNMSSDIGDTSRVPPTGRVHETGILVDQNAPVASQNGNTSKERPLHNNNGVANEVVTYIDMKSTESGANSECTEVNSDNGVTPVSGTSIVVDISGATVHTSRIKNQETCCHIGGSNTNVLNTSDTDDVLQQYSLLFDINDASDLHTRGSVLDKLEWRKHVELLKATCSDFRLWRAQMDFNFGFVPLSNLVIKNCSNHIETSIHDHIQHMVARKHNLPNYLGARIQVNSQLNIEEWELELSEYWFCTIEQFGGQELFKSHRH